METPILRLHPAAAAAAAAAAAGVTVSCQVVSWLAVRW